MVTIEIVINSNHVAQNFALHPADMHCPAWAMQSFLVFFPVRKNPIYPALVQQRHAYVLTVVTRETSFGGRLTGFTSKEGVTVTPY